MVSQLRTGNDRFNHNYVTDAQHKNEIVTEFLCTWNCSTIVARNGSVNLLLTCTVLHAERACALCSVLLLTVTNNNPDIDLMNQKYGNCVLFDLCMVICMYGRSNETILLCGIVVAYEQCTRTLYALPLSTRAALMGSSDS